MIATLTVGLVFPSPAYAQFGLLGGVQNILNIINGAVRSTLNTIGAIARSVEATHQQTVWPVQLINPARSAIASPIGQFRGQIASIYRAPVGSATLSTPIH